MERQYYVTDSSTITAAGTRSIMFVTPAQRRRVRCDVIVTANAVTTVQLYEGGDRVAGTTLTPIAADRVASSTPLMTASHTPTGGTTDGTLIGMAIARLQETVTIQPTLQLKNNRNYVLKLTAGGADATHVTVIAWDEEFSMMTTTTTTTSTTSSTSSTTSSTSSSSSSSSTTSSTTTA